MVKRKNIDKKVTESIKKLVERMRYEKIPVHSAILFGSWAKGNQTSTSDIDLCIVSTSFGKDEVTDLQWLLKESREIDDRIEPIPVSLKSFNSNATPLILEIKKHGMKVSFDN